MGLNENTTGQFVFLGTLEVKYGGTPLSYHNSGYRAERAIAIGEGNIKSIS